MRAKTTLTREEIEIQIDLLNMTTISNNAQWVVGALVQILQLKKVFYFQEISSTAPFGQPEQLDS